MIAPRRALSGRLGPAAIALLAAAVIGLAAAPSAVADPPPNRTVNYQIRRNGDPIGTHRVVFERGEGERFTVTHRIDIRVTILALEAYRYVMDSRETWEGDRLLGLYANTDKNGEALQVFGRASGSGIRLRGPTGPTQAPTDAVPSSPQHFVFDRARTSMIEAEDGRVLRVRVSPPAEESLRLGGRDVPCRRVRVSGGLDATLWYAPSGILVRKRLRAPDGSTILTVLM